MLAGPKGRRYRCLVRPVGLHYADNLFRVYLDVGQADTVTRLVDGDFAAVAVVELKPEEQFEITL